MPTQRLTITLNDIIFQQLQTAASTGSVSGYINQVLSDHFENLHWYNQTKFSQTVASLRDRGPKYSVRKITSLIDQGRR